MRDFLDENSFVHFVLKFWHSAQQFLNDCCPFAPAPAPAPAPSRRCRCCMCHIRCHSLALPPLSHTHSLCLFLLADMLTFVFSLMNFSHLLALQAAPCSPLSLPPSRFSGQMTFDVCWITRQTAAKYSLDAALCADSTSILCTRVFCLLNLYF